MRSLGVEIDGGRLMPFALILGGGLEYVIKEGGIDVFCLIFVEVREVEGGSGEVGSDGRQNWLFMRI